MDAQGVGADDLMEHPGQLHSSKKLLQMVWGYSDKPGSIDVVRHHTKNIREKIEPDPSAPHYIRTVRRHGYIVGE